MKREVALDVLKLTEREKALIRYGRRLDPDRRHRVTVVYRGTEPWEIEEHISQIKTVLIPEE